MFFSFPLIYPYLLNAIVPQNLLPKFLRFGSIRHRLPRPIVSTVTLVVMALAVHYNTIVHPFTLADNRHYIFYIFRILLRHPSVKYLAVPFYFLCAWSAIQALGRMPDKDGDAPAAPPNPRSKNLKKKDNNRNNKTATPTSSSNTTHRPNPSDQSNRTSFLLIYLLTTTLSLITAPLVEPRYFILPWLIWRLHVPVIQTIPPTTPANNSQITHPTTDPQDRPISWLDKVQDVTYRKRDHRLWLETAWFLLVNGATCYIFLYWGFEWPSEEGKVQRFMW